MIAANPAASGTAMVVERHLASAREAVHEWSAPAIDVDRTPPASAPDPHVVRRRREGVERATRRGGVDRATRGPIDAAPEVSSPESAGADRRETLGEADPGGPRDRHPRRRGIDLRHPRYELARHARHRARFTPAKSPCVDRARGTARASGDVNRRQAARRSQQNPPEQRRTPGFYKLPAAPRDKY